MVEKFGNQINALWRRAICNKYKIIEDCWHPLIRPSYKHSRMWSGILSIEASSSSIFNFFLANCPIKVGNGNRIRFWTDRWCGDICLKYDFPLLFNLSTDKEGSLHQLFARKTSSSVWNFPHRRELYGWKLAEEASLIAVLSSALPLCNENADCLIWSNDAASHTQFSVFGLYSQSTSLLGPNLKICKHVWSTVLPPKVSFFCWLAWKNRVKSLEFLHKIGILDSSVATLCPFCNSKTESTIHVLLHCPFSWLIWSAVIQEWGFQWCILNSVAGLLNWWIGGKF
ncbi:hypothetical protein ACSBR2_026144 [Camellia fascicularis]